MLPSSQWERSSAASPMLRCSRWRAEVEMHIALTSRSRADQGVLGTHATLSLGVAPLLSPNGWWAVYAHLPRPAEGRAARCPRGAVMNSRVSTLPVQLATRRVAWGQLASILRPRRGTLALVGLSVLLSKTLDLAPPLLIQRIVDD